MITPIEMEPHAEAFPVAIMDLSEEIQRMRSSPHHRSHVGKTLVRTPDLRVVLMVLAAHVRIPEHRVAGATLLQVVEGRVVVGLLGGSFDLQAGQVLSISAGIAHELVAIEDSALLLTMPWAG